MPDSVGKPRRYRELTGLRLGTLVDRLRESLLFLPTVMLISALVLAEFFDHLDHRKIGPVIPERFQFAPEVVTVLLSTIAGAMITAAAVVFSLLLISLHLVSRQFSPRVLRGFWRDRFSHLLIGLLLSTFAFCVVALARVDVAQEFAPPYTVLFALVLTLGSVLGIVAYLDRVIRQQYIGNIMRRVLAESLYLIAGLPYGRHSGGQVGEPVTPPSRARSAPRW
ncbi:DUF2254 family protein [Phytohabitans flavus]|uniref:DUF2254 domain-containing protein n=1 Tax=Phytohabitans flavus TaxID=1076124 RepID=A0A6F8XPX2_9ACTN|nr:DUF2254 family protein [Phytohabitans flavus]BCB75866.1 hypothetical protein Pflav_022760 [Phytohabitans flavus]